jgi:excisionase family DNA binding protein
MGTMGTADAARKVGVEARTIRKWIDAGKLPARKLDVGWLINEADLAPWLTPEPLPSNGHPPAPVNLPIRGAAGLATLQTARQLAALIPLLEQIQAVEHEDAALQEQLRALREKTQRLKEWHAKLSREIPALEDQRHQLERDIQRLREAKRREAYCRRCGSSVTMS